MDELTAGTASPANEADKVVTVVFLISFGMNGLPCGRNRGVLCVRVCVCARGTMMLRYAHRVFF